MENSEILIKTLEKENNILKENIAILKKQKGDEENKFKEENQKLKKENKELREQLDSILYSRSYKFSQKLKKIIKG